MSPLEMVVESSAPGSAGTGMAAQAAAPSGLPCLDSHNSTKELAGSHRRTAFALRENVRLLAQRFGLERLGFLTLTFGDHVVSIKEAQRRFNSLRTHVLAERYLASITIVERCLGGGKAHGRIHFHVLVVLSGDIRTGFDFDAIANDDYRTAGPLLRGEWAFWRQTARKFGFGRTELLPVKSTEEAISKYLGKYIAKHMGARNPKDKGARLVRYTADARQVGTGFAWFSKRSTLYRLKLAKVAREFGCGDLSEMKETFGSRWAYNLSGYIKSQRLQVDEYPSWDHMMVDLQWYAERGYYAIEDTARFILGEEAVNAAQS